MGSDAVAWLTDPSRRAFYFGGPQVTENNTSYSADHLRIDYSDHSWLNETLDIDFSTGNGTAHEWGHTGGWNYEPFDSSWSLMDCKLN